MLLCVPVCQEFQAQIMALSRLRKSPTNASFLSTMMLFYTCCCFSVGSMYSWILVKWCCNFCYGCFLYPASLLVTPTMPRQYSALVWWWASAGQHRPVIRPLSNVCWVMCSDLLMISWHWGCPLWNKVLSETNLLFLQMVIFSHCWFLFMSVFCWMIWCTMNPV